MLYPNLPHAVWNDGTWAVCYCFPNLGYKQAIAMLCVNQEKTDKPELAHILNTHTPEHCVFTKMGPHLTWDIWTIFAILHVGHLRLISYPSYLDQRKA